MNNRNVSNSAVWMNLNVTAAIYIVGMIAFSMASETLQKSYAGSYSALAFLGYFFLMIWGMIRGFKNRVIIFHDNSDALTTFVPLLAILVVVLILSFIGKQNWVESSIFLIFFAFLFYSARNAVKYNPHNNPLDILGVICLKVFVGILYPLMILNKMNDKGSSKASKAVIVGFMITASIFFVRRLTNTDEVELSRLNKDVTSKYNKEIAFALLGLAGTLCALAMFSYLGRNH